MAANETCIMLRYFVLATAIVLGCAVVIAGWVNRDALRIKIASVYAPARPKPQPAGASGNAVRAGVHGDAPWALSALPECLIQTSETTGPLDYVLRQVPAGATPVVPPATLRYGDCTIWVTGDEAFVRRGDDRLHIPPRVRFYRKAGLLVLLHETANGNELRVYEMTAR
jgi:hypothetical protein